MGATTTPIILKSNPGIKRDGTMFDGDFYTDGQWVRFQRGLPRKIGGFRSINKFLSEISRGFTSFAQMSLQYCHSGGAEALERFTIDNTKNSSIISDRTPVAVAAFGTVSLTGGIAGAVNSVTVNGVTVTSGAVAFATNLATTATNLAADITAFSSSPNYTATANGTTVTITATTAGAASNGFAVATTLTTITTTTTPLAGGSNALVEDDNNKWMFDYEYESSSTDNLIIAHVAPNNATIINDVGGQVFVGDVLGTAPLVEVQLREGTNATGGIVVLHPYLLYYGTAGVIAWSAPGEPTDMTGTGSGAARAWGQKIIKGFPLRAGAGSAPAGIFWAYDAIVRAQFSGGESVFQFDVLATGTSIMSPDSVIDYDGVFFWAGVDRFMMFNGVVRDVPNQMNINWFLDNLNETQSAKVFAFKVPRFGEIWWCYPRDDAEECSHAVIYNVRESTWYDTTLPESGRSAATFANAFKSPLMTDAVEVASGFRVWIHEQGVDAIDGISVEPIQSYFETADLSSVVQGDPTRVRITQIEPDFIQTGDMTVQVFGRANARAKDVAGEIFTFPDVPTQTSQEIVMLKEQRRELRVRFESNAVNGDYQMGQILGHFGPGDKTMLGST